MTRNETLDAAADLLWRYAAAGERITMLPENLRPSTLEEAYEIQQRIEDRDGAARIGWKIAATSQAGQAHIRVAHPLAGRLRWNVMLSGDTCALENNLMRVAEPEFAFRIGIDLPPRSKPYQRTEVLNAIDTLHPAIEVPDTRLEKFDEAGAFQLTADNACSHRFALGPATSAAWRDIDLSQSKVTAQLRGHPAVVGGGANVLGDPIVALCWLVNEVTTHKMVLRAGEIVTTGTCVPPLGVVPGARVEADFGVIGKIALNFM